MKGIVGGSLLGAGCWAFTFGIIWASTALGAIGAVLVFAGLAVALRPNLPGDDDG